MNSPRILLALQFWRGDRDRADALARVIADLEPAKSRVADFLLSAHPTTQPNAETVRALSRRFNVFTHVGNTKLDGYPAGAFGTWHDTVTHVRDSCQSGVMPRYSCILTFESDCAPLRRGWIEDLLSHWEQLKQPCIAAGQEWPAPECPHPHLNGNLLISGSAEHLDALAGWHGDPRIAWDVEIYPFLKARGGRGTPLIRSVYIRKAGLDFTRRLCVLGGVFYHGDKDGSVLELVKHHVVRREAATALKGASEPEDGIHRYPDNVPSVFEQVPGSPLKFAGPVIRRFNPGLAPDGAGGWYVATRISEAFDGGNHLRLARFGPEFEFRNEGVITGLPAWATPGRISYYEDPRLLRSGSELLMPFGHNGYFPTIWTQALALVDPDTRSVIRNIPLPYCGNVERPGVVQKNWQFFGTPRGLFCVYSINPFVILEVATGRQYRFLMVPSYHWFRQYGEPRGGTPPVQIGPDRWISFMHSWTEHRGRARRYHWGAFEFTMSGRGQITVPRFTRHPIATASERDGFLWGAGGFKWEPVVVFPTGAHRSDAGKWTVSAGINDSYAAVFHFDDAFLNAAFARTQAPRY